MKRITVIALLALALCGQALAAGPGYTQATVLSVHDVDTFTARVEGFDVAQRVRVADIDGPELRVERRGKLIWPAQPWAALAASWAKAVLTGQTVWLWIFEPDRNGRLVCRVHLPGDVDYALEALRLGHAHAYDRYRPAPAYEAMEDHARRGRAGLWSLPRPIRPEKWRRGAWRGQAASGR